jgi:predicted phosphodiesterase
MTTTTDRGWELEFPDDGVSRVRLVMPERAGAGEWEHWTWLGSDIHYDSKDCDREQYHRTMREAVDCNASIVQVGDIFDVMQGPNDRRGCKSALRDDLFRAAYFDEVVNQWVEDHLPYADHFAAVGYGNHETAVTRHYATDLIDRSLSMLRLRTGCGIVPGGYEGAVIFSFQFGALRRSKRLYYYHGSGGGGPVTRDTIGMERRRAMVDGFDIIATGHTHDLWMDDSTQKHALSASGRWKPKRQASVKTGTFKVNSKPGKRAGWETEKGIRRKGTGGWWIRWFFNERTDDVDFELRRML